MRNGSYGEFLHRVAGHLYSGTALGMDAWIDRPVACDNVKNNHGGDDDDDDSYDDYYYDDYDDDVDDDDDDAGDGDDEDVIKTKIHSS